MATNITTTTVTVCDEESYSSEEPSPSNDIPVSTLFFETSDIKSEFSDCCDQYPLPNNAGIINQTLRQEINRQIEIGNYEMYWGFNNDKVKNPELETWRLFRWYVNELNNHDCGVFAVCPKIMGRLTLSSKHMQKFCSDFGLDRNNILYTSNDLTKVVKSILMHNEGKTSIFIVVYPRDITDRGSGVYSRVLIITSHTPKKFYYFDPLVNHGSLRPIVPVIQVREKYRQDCNARDKIIYMCSGSQTTTTDSLERCLIFVSDVIETQNYLDGRVWSQYSVRKRKLID